jgi:hypothetical protein
VTYHTTHGTIKDILRAYPHIDLYDAINRNTIITDWEYNEIGKESRSMGRARGRVGALPGGPVDPPAKTVLYVGQTRAKGLMKELQSLGIRELTQRTDMPPRRAPYALDNGCFEDFTEGRPFDYIAFWRGLKGIRREATRPDFVVMPDIVRGGDASLEFSKEWYRLWGREFDDLNLNWYFVVQDGMTPETLDLSWGKIAGIFVGGSIEWKVKTGASWVKYAHERGMKCHIGRAASVDRVLWARRIGADSIDGNGPLWTKEALVRVMKALNEPQSGMELF